MTAQRHERAADLLVPKDSVSGRQPPNLRTLVCLLDNGRCVNCNAGPFFADQSNRVWVVHHVLEQQVLKRNHLEEHLGNPNACCLLCPKCHTKHHGVGIKFDRVKLAKLPARCTGFCKALGTWAEAALERLYA